MENNIKKGLKPEQKQQLKKYAVFAMMFLVFGGSMWLIFKPDKNDKVTQRRFRVEHRIANATGK